jgi:regulatory protein SWI6
MSEMVNARDISGNTALNLVARIGNRSIIRQLVEVQADPTIPNHKGLRPVDFGVEPRQPEGVEQLSQSVMESPSKQKSPSKAEEVSREMMPCKFSCEAGVHSTANWYTHSTHFVRVRNASSVFC